MSSDFYRQHKIFGFSIMELVVVIIITGVLASVALFFWPDRSTDIYAEAQKFAAYVRMTQQYSMIPLQTPLRS